MPPVAQERRRVCHTRRPSLWYRNPDAIRGYACSSTLCEATTRQPLQATTGDALRESCTLGRAGTAIAGESTPLLLSVHCSTPRRPRVRHPQPCNIIITLRNHSRCYTPRTSLQSKTGGSRIATMGACSERVGRNIAKTSACVEEQG